MIRLARPEEIALLADVEASASELFRGTDLEFAIDHPPLDRERHERAVAEGTLWLALEDEAIAGFLCAHRIADMLFVDELCVASDFQRRGHGRALLHKAIEEARRDFDAVSLITDRFLAWNAPFYARHGFVELADPHPEIVADLKDEAEDGFDPARRCAMILRFG